MQLTLAQLKKIIKEEITKKVQAETGASTDVKKIPLGEKDEERADESQRGNDENSQHDNDTEPGDPMLKRLKETALRDLRLADKILRRR